MLNLRLLLVLCVCCLQIQAQSTPVKAHGQLSVNGNKIVDQSGTPVVLNGMSLFWSQWFPQFWNEKALSWLVKDWKIQIVRAAMAVNKGGYVENPAKEKAKMVTVIKAAIKLGIYVIVDWHAENEDPQVSHAKKFFGEIAKEFGMFPNVLFEPFNEPSANSWPATKKYHENIVRVIRKYSKNICILGTAAWSQDVDTAADDPVRGENIAYTLHFYAATHKQSFRNKADYALKKGIAIFITEWGTCDASGNGGLDFLKQTHGSIGLSKIRSVALIGEFMINKRVARLCHPGPVGMEGGRRAG
jgi:endoglucanase